jgi:hypothetical protein
VGKGKRMNEKIKQLAEQARAWVNDTNNVSPDIEYVFYKDAYDKKFAELIVRECAELIDSMDHSSQYFPHVADAIKEHFGVEE